MIISFDLNFNWVTPNKTKPDKTDNQVSTYSATLDI